MNKEEKKFFKEYADFLPLMYLIFFSDDFEYFYLFKNIIINAAFNIIFGIIVIILLITVYKDINNLFKEKEIGKSTLNIYKLLSILALITSFYHIGYAIGNIIAVI